MNKQMRKVSGSPGPVTSQAKWKPLAPKPPAGSGGGSGSNGAPPQIPGLSNQKCVNCLKPLPVTRTSGAGVVQCDECNERMNTFKNVFSSVAKISSDSPPVITGLGVTPNLYRKAAEMRQGLPTTGKADPVDNLGFGEMDWNSFGLIGRPLPNESLSEEDLTPRRVRLLDNETPKISTAASAVPSSTTKIKITPGTTARKMSNVNVKGSASNPKKIIVIKNAMGVQEVLEEQSPGKYVKCSDPLKLKKCLEATRANNGVKAKMGVGRQQITPSPQKPPNIILKPSFGLSQQKHRLIAPKPPAFPAQSASLISHSPPTPRAIVVTSATCATPSPSRFMLPMPTTSPTQQKQVFQQKSPVTIRPASPPAPKTIIDACGSMSCPVCRKSFWKRNSLNTHIATIHKNSRAFCCGHCNTKFTLLINIINHKLQTHPNVIKFLCRSCGLETHDQNFFNMHVSPNFGTAKFDCGCGEQFKTPVSMQAHQKATNHASRNDSGLQQLKAEASKPPPTPTKSASPVVSGFAPVKEVKVEKPKKQDPKLAKLVPKHELGLVVNGSIKCPSCPGNVYFGHYKYLDLHIEVKHSGDKVLPCQFCKLKFSRLLELVSHKVNAHSKMSQWTCKLCGVSHLDESDYCSHLNTHSIVTNDCRCGEQFATEDGLEEHGRTTHPGVSVFKCFETKIQEFSGTSPESDATECPQASPKKAGKVLPAPLPAPLPTPRKPTPSKAEPAPKTPPKQKSQKETKMPILTPAVVKTYGKNVKSLGDDDEIPKEQNKDQQATPKRQATSARKRPGQPVASSEPKLRKVISSPNKGDNKTASVNTTPAATPEPPKPGRGRPPGSGKKKKGRGRPPSVQASGSSAKKPSLQTPPSTKSSKKASGADDDSVRRSGRERRPKKVD